MEVNIQIQALKKEALEHYQQKNFAVSLQFWQKILKVDPKNSLAILYVRRIQQMEAKPSPERKQRVAEKPPEKQAVEPEKIKIMVVDDSAMMRKAIVRMLASSPQFEVEAVSSGEEALERIPQVNPDVVTLDVNMPGMDGIATLKHIMVHYPRPVIMLSAFTEEGATATFDCLFYGAIDFICKSTKGMENIKQQEENFKNKLLSAARVRVSTPNKARAIKKGVKDTVKRDVAKWVVAMGGGEGGYHAYLKVIPHLPAKIPCAILAIQRTQEEYLQPFCDYLNRTSRIPIKRARQGEVIEEGVCYFSHDGNYLKIEQSSEGPYCQITPKPTIIAQQNVVNQLFFSVSEKFGSHSMGVLLTGSGGDGIEGLQELRRTHAITLVQDPKTCLTPDVINAALQARCVDHVVKDVDIPAMIWHLLKSRVGGGKIVLENSGQME